MPKALNIDKSQFSNLFHHNYRLDSFNHVRIRTAPTFWGESNKKPTLFFLHWYLEYFGLWTQLDFQCRVFPQILTWFFSSRSQNEVDYFCWNMRLKINSFRPVIGILKDQKCKKVLLVLISFSATCFNCPSNSQLIAFACQFLKINPLSAFSKTFVKAVSFVGQWSGAFSHKEKSNWFQSIPLWMTSCVSRHWNQKP